ASSVSAHTNSQVVGQSSGAPRCPVGAPSTMDATAPTAAPATTSHQPVATAGRRHHTPAANATTPATASTLRTVAVPIAGTDTPTRASPVATARYPHHSHAAPRRPPGPRPGPTGDSHVMAAGDSQVIAAGIGAPVPFLFINPVFRISTL